MELKSSFAIVGSLAFIVIVWIIFMITAVQVCLSISGWRWCVCWILFLKMAKLTNVFASNTCILHSTCVEKLCHHGWQIVIMNSFFDGRPLALWIHFDHRMLQRCSCDFSGWKTLDLRNGWVLWSGPIALGKNGFKVVPASRAAWSIVISQLFQNHQLVTMAHAQSL